MKETESGRDGGMRTKMVSLKGATLAIAASTLLLCFLIPTISAVRTAPLDIPVPKLPRQYTVHRAVKECGEGGSTDCAGYTEMFYFDFK